MALLKNRFTFLFLILFLFISAMNAFPLISFAQAAPQKNDADPKKITVSVLAGNVREKPSIKAEIKFVIKKGDEVSLHKAKKGWYFIEDDRKRTGWASRKLFSKKALKQSVRNKKNKIINQIEVYPLNADGEIIVFMMGGDAKPEIMVIEGEIPRIVCDFYNTSLSKDLGADIEKAGKFVERIRFGLHGPPKPKTRVVLDLLPDGNYIVAQFIDAVRKRFMLEIRRQNAPPGTSSRYRR